MGETLDYGLDGRPDAEDEDMISSENPIEGEVRADNNSFATQRELGLA